MEQDERTEQQRPKVKNIAPRKAYIQWMPADQLRERDGGILDVEAWARANDERAAHPS